VQLPRPQPGVALEVLRGEAEDLLDLGGDVAPAPVLPQLGGVDDHRQALDQTSVVLPGDLVEQGEFVVALRAIGVGLIFGA
jgi:hypothetical protein